MFNDNKFNIEVIEKAPKLDIEFTDEIFNESFYDVWGAQERHLNLVGGAGSGKSVDAAQKILIRLLTEFNHRFLILRKVERTIRNSQFQLFKDLVNDYDLDSLFKFKDGDLTFTCPSTGGKVISAGLDNVEKLKSITGITGTWIEEATELTKSDYQQVNMRMRGETEYYKQHILTYNPIDEFHWLNARFFNKEDTRSKILQTTFADNKFLDWEYIEELCKLEEEDPVLWKIYGLGEWATAQGLIYTNWQELKKFPEPLEDLVYGLDFGYTAQTALIRVGKIGNELYLTEKLYQSHLTNTELIQILKSNDELSTKKVLIYADNEDPNRIRELQNAGFRIGKVDKDVTAGLEYCRRYKWNVFIESDNLKKELRSYKYKQDAHSGIWLEQPVKFRDHLLDAARMAIFSHGKVFWRTHQFTSSVRVRHKREREDITANY